MMTAALCVNTSANVIDSATYNGVTLGSRRILTTIDFKPLGRREAGLTPDDRRFFGGPGYKLQLHSSSSTWSF